jgi:hypothetical protein
MSRSRPVIPATLLAAAGAALLLGAAADARAQAKTLLMHYMPWFQSPEIRGYWGKHWTGFNNEANPDTIAPDGRPDIWSNYDPLIGPYDSMDPDVLECHLLQMKLAGVDGVIVDWYGLSSAADYALNHEATEALFDACADFSMDFAICFEDRTIEYRVNTGQLWVSQITNDMTSMLGWMQTNWFSQPQYFEKDGAPLLLNFGPIYLSDPAVWDAALGSVPIRPAFFPLHHLWQGVDGDGGFNWVHASVWDGNPSEAVIKQRLINTFNATSSNPDQVIPSAISGFDEAYVGQSYPPVDHRDGATLRECLEVGIDGPWDIIQLVTWNDFTEGTMIEPTYEFGYTFLEVIQQERAEELAPLFPFTPDDLRLPTQLFFLRKAGTTPDATLDQISQWLSLGDTASARAAINAALGQLFTSQPADMLCDAGGALVFSASVDGGGPNVSLRWERDGTPLTDDGRISGSDTETLTILQAGVDDVGVYRLVVTIDGLVVESASAAGAVRASGDPNDVNGDGVVDVLDVLDLEQALSGSP